jgi:hypothetical protein
MGKNPNAKKLKAKHHKDRTTEVSLEELAEEAARQGKTLEELIEEREADEEEGEEELSEVEEEELSKKELAK